MKNDNPLEKVIESKVCTYARSKGIEAIKFNSMNRAAVPDRIFIAPGNRIFFVEFKRLGQRPTVAQEREHARLRTLGCNVYVIDNINDGIELVNRYAQV